MSPNAVVIQEQLRIPMDITSLGKFREWTRTEEFPERGISYIGGEIDVDVSPEELNHNKEKAALDRGLGAIIETEDVGPCSAAESF
ncbi:MAG: hypothetical protein HYU36_07900 [Planctomycetes bacterium]|nr:hypothetical protein [Planctomycetota bacterium]